MKVIYLNNNIGRIEQITHIKYIEDFIDYFIVKDNKGNKKTYTNCELLIVEEYQKKASK